MKKIKNILLTILLASPFQIYRPNTTKIIDISNPIDTSRQFSSIKKQRSNNKNINEVIIVYTNDIEKNNSEENNKTELVNDLRNTLFPRRGSNYSENRQTRGSRSRIDSNLTFRQRTTSTNGVVRPHTGASDPTNRENLNNFEAAGIPIDPMRDRRKKPDTYNTWRWSNSGKKWILQGERKIRANNGAIITESEWQRMLIHNSRQI